MASKDWGIQIRHGVDLNAARSAPDIKEPMMAEEPADAAAAAQLEGDDEWQGSAQAGK